MAQTPWFASDFAFTWLAPVAILVFEIWYICLNPIDDHDLSFFDAVPHKRLPG